MRGESASSLLACAVIRHVETLLMFLDGEQRTSREIRHSRAISVLGHVLRSSASDWSLDVEDRFLLDFTQ